MLFLTVLFFIQIKIPVGLEELNFCAMYCLITDVNFETYYDA